MTDAVRVIAYTLGEQLKRMGQLLASTGDTHGNLSCRISDDEFFIKASGLPFEQASSQSICRIKRVRSFPDFTGKFTSTCPLGYKPSVDTAQHLEIYRTYPEVKSVCHTHTPYATAFAALNKPIPCFTTDQADIFGGEIPIGRLVDSSNSEYLWSVSCDPESDGSYAFLIPYHGVVTTGATPGKALELALAVENFAQKAFLIQTLHASDSMSRPIPLNPQIIKKWNDRYKEEYGQNGKGVHQF